MKFESGGPGDESFYPSRRSVAGLRHLLYKGAGERVVDEHIKQYLALLTRLLSVYGTGHSGFKALSQQSIRPSVRDVQAGLIPDYLISASNSNGKTWWVVELKSPKKAMFVGSGRNLRFSRDTSQGLVQLMRYVDFCERHQESLENTLDLKDLTRPQGILLIGRAEEVAGSPERMAIKGALTRFSPQLQIRTYDSLMRGSDDEFLDADVSLNRLEKPDVSEFGW